MSPQRNVQWDKTYDIELGKYNSAEELLIETRTTGSQDMYAIRMELESICNWAAVRMGWKGQGCEQGTGVHTNGVQVRNEHRDVEDNCRAIKKC